MINGHSCLIVGASPEINIRLVQVHAQSHDLIICADGGLDAVLQAGIAPDIVVGDEDSGTFSDLPDHVIIRRLPTQKDETDLHACINAALELGVTSITIAGCTGGRLDHFLATVFLLEYIHSSGAKGCIVDTANEIYLHTGGAMTFDNLRPGDYVSLLPLDSKVENVTLTGLKYPLNGVDLTRDNPIGVSNCIDGTDSVNIETKSGKMLVVISRNI